MPEAAEIMPGMPIPLPGPVRLPLNFPVHHAMRFAMRPPMPAQHMQVCTTQYNHPSHKKRITLIKNHFRFIQIKPLVHECEIIRTHALIELLHDSRDD